MHIFQIRITPDSLGSMPARVGISRTAATSPTVNQSLLKPGEHESFDSSEVVSSGPGSRKSGACRNSLKLTLKQRYNRVKPRTWLIIIFLTVRYKPDLPFMMLALQLSLVACIASYVASR
jgi:hypothetical protein